MSARADVVIVGAGPAGAALAIRLARRGRSVVLVDGARFPREKSCGEGLQPAGVAALQELGVAGAIEPVARPFDGIRYRLPDGTRAEARFPAGARGWGVARRDLDARLLEAAAATAGVRVVLGRWARGFERAADGVRLDLGDGERVAARALVGADGLASNVRAWAGLELPPPARPRFGVVGHLRATHDARDAFVEVFVAPGFELYTTPIGASASTGARVDGGEAPGDVTCAALLVDVAELDRLRARHGGRLEAALREALAQAGGRCAPLARAERVGPVRALGPLARPARAAHAERVLLVGDAAGALDPITGEGVALGLVTGAIAAEVLEAALARDDLSARALATWTRRRAAEVRAPAALTRLVLHAAARPARAARVVRALARAPGTFDRALAVAAGLAPLSSLTLRDGLRVLLGV